MTKVYCFAVLEGYEWVVPESDADFEVFRGFDGTSRTNGWAPIPMKLVKQDEQGEPLMDSDVPWLGEHAPVLRRRSVEALSDLLVRDCELLPLACAEADLTVLNVRRVVDALDLERSELVRFPSSGRIMKVKSHLFRSERLNGVKVFKVPDLLRGATFVTDEVVEAAESHDLKGVGFQLLWEETPTAQ